MDTPVLVEVLRGPMVESAHRGAFVVADAAGRTIFTAGEAAMPVYPRSAIKALQALPLIESGAADALGLTDAELALACSSHGGEARHVAAAAAMLAKAGRDEACLECGVHWPMHAAAAQALARSGGAPGPLHNNCSGKHAGFVCLAVQSGHDPAGYVGRAHPVQQMVADAVAAMTGTDLGEASVCGVDGCSIPTYAIPLDALARAFARFGSGEGLGPERARAAARLRRACAAEPFMVAGSGRFCTDVMTLLGPRAFVKTGAEGVFCVALPDQGLGVAVKCLDGASRAAEVIAAALIARFLPLEGEEGAAFRRFVAPRLVNWRGVEVGSLRPAGPLAS